MSEPLPAQPPIGSLEELRAIAVEQLSLCAFHAHLGAEQGTVAADAGLAYNARRAVAHLRAATDALKLMHAHRMKSLARRAERDGAAVALGMEKPGAPA